MQQNNNVRFLTLDAMRGVAAIIVVLYHLNFIGPLAPSGYLAVDFFFLMSGLVIAKTYQDRLANGLKLSDFIIQRTSRLMPLYALGLLIGFTRRAAQIVADHPEKLSIEDLTMSSIFNLVLLPSPGTKEISPINGPGWSLIFEMFVNLIWATFLFRLNKSTMLLLIVLFGVILGGAILDKGSADYGSEWSAIHIGLLRSFFGFSLGVFLNRVIRKTHLHDSVNSLIAIFLLCIILLLNISPTYREFYDIVVIAIAFPLIAWAGISFNPPEFFKRIADTLGKLSYPLYAIHLAPLFTLSYVARKWKIEPFIWIPLFIALLCCASIYLSRTYDPYARQRLKLFLSNRKKTLK